MLGRPLSVATGLLLLTALLVVPAGTATGPEDPRPPECGYRETHLPGVHIVQYRSWLSQGCRGTVDVTLLGNVCLVPGLETRSYIAGGWTVTVHVCDGTGDLAFSGNTPCKDAGAGTGLVDVLVHDDCTAEVVLFSGLACLWDTRHKTVKAGAVAVTYYYCGNGQEDA